MFKENLKNYVPEFHRNNKSMEEFLEVVGEVLDGYMGAINDMANNQDYQVVGEERLDLIAEQFDIEFFRNISLERKRQFVREAVDLYRTNGTEKALLRVFKLIGWDVEIDYCWTPDPSWYDGQPDGTVFNLENTNESLLPLSKYEVIFGREVFYENEGMFVHLYDASNAEYPKYPIYHENYQVFVQEPHFVKVPYIRIIVNQEDYDLFTKERGSEDSSKVYAYTDAETNLILKDIRNYFLEQARPAHVAVLELATPFSLEDKIIYTMLEYPTLQTKNAGARYDGTLMYGSAKIDRYLPGEAMGNFFYGTNDMEYFGVDEISPTETFTVIYEPGVVNLQNHILCRTNTTLRVTVPSDAYVNIMATKSNGKEIVTGDPEWEFIQSVSNITDEVITLDGYIAFAVNVIDTPALDDIEVEVELK